MAKFTLTFVVLLVGLIQLATGQTTYYPFPDAPGRVLEADGSTVGESDFYVGGALESVGPGSSISIVDDLTIKNGAIVHDTVVAHGDFTSAAEPTNFGSLTVEGETAVTDDLLLGGENQAEFPVSHVGEGDVRIVSDDEVFVVDANNVAAAGSKVNIGHEADEIIFGNLHSNILIEGHFTSDDLATVRVQTDSDDVESEHIFGGETQSGSDADVTENSNFSDMLSAGNMDVVGDISAPVVTVHDTINTGPVSTNHWNSDTINVADTAQINVLEAITGHASSNIEATSLRTADILTDSDVNLVGNAQLGTSDQEFSTVRPTGKDGFATTFNGAECTDNGEDGGNVVIRSGVNLDADHHDGDVTLSGGNGVEVDGQVIFQGENVEVGNTASELHLNQGALIEEGLSVDTDIILGKDSGNFEIRVEADTDASGITIGGATTSISAGHGMNSCDDGDLIIGHQKDSNVNFADLEVVSGNQFQITGDATVSSEFDSDKLYSRSDASVASVNTTGHVHFAGDNLMIGTSADGVTMTNDVGIVFRGQDSSNGNGGDVTFRAGNGGNGNGGDFSATQADFATESGTVQIGRAAANGGGLSLLGAVSVDEGVRIGETLRTESIAFDKLAITGQDASKPGYRGGHVKVEADGEIVVAGAAQLAARGGEVHVLGDLEATVTDFKVGGDFATTGDVLVDGADVTASFTSGTTVHLNRPTSRGAGSSTDFEASQVDVTADVVEVGAGDAAGSCVGGSTVISGVDSVAVAADQVTVGTESGDVTISNDEGSTLVSGEFTVAKLAHFKSTVAGENMATDESEVDGNAAVSGSATVNDVVSGNYFDAVTGVVQTVDVEGHSHITGAAVVDQSSEIGGTFDAAGDSSVGSLGVLGKGKFDDVDTAFGNVGGNGHVAGDATFGGLNVREMLHVAKTITADEVSADNLIADTFTADTVANAGLEGNAGQLMTNTLSSTDAHVFGNLKIDDGASVATASAKDFNVEADLIVETTLDVKRTSQINDLQANTITAQAAVVSGDVNAAVGNFGSLESGSVDVSGTFTNDGDITGVTADLGDSTIADLQIETSTDIDDDVTGTSLAAAGTLKVAKSVNIAGTSEVIGDTWVGGSIEGASLNNVGDLTVGGDANINGDFTTTNAEVEGNIELGSATFGALSAEHASVGDFVATDVTVGDLLANSISGNDATVSNLHVKNLAEFASVSAGGDFNVEGKLDVGVDGVIAGDSLVLGLSAKDYKIKRPEDDGDARRLTVSGQSGTAAGGDLVLIGGEGDAGNGGNVNAYGGDSSSEGVGGDVNIRSGNGDNGAGGNIEIFANDGGDVKLDAGVGSAGEGGVNLGRQSTRSVSIGRAEHTTEFMGPLVTDTDASATGSYTGHANANFVGSSTTVNGNGFSGTLAVADDASTAALSAQNAHFGGEMRGADLTVAGESNLGSVDSADLKVIGDFNVGNDLEVQETSSVNGNVYVSEDLILASGSLSTGNDLFVKEDVNIAVASTFQHLAVDGAFYALEGTIQRKVEIDGSISAASLNAEAVAAGAVDISGVSNVGEIRVVGKVDINQDLNGQAASFGGDLQVDDHVTSSGLSADNLIVGQDVSVRSVVVLGTATIEDLKIVSDANVQDLGITTMLHAGSASTTNDLTVGGTTEGADVAVTATASAESMHVGGNLAVDVASTFEDSLAVGGDMDTNTLSIARKLEVRDDATAGSSDVSGVTQLNTLAVSGSSTFGPVQSTGDWAVTGNVEVGANARIEHQTDATLLSVTGAGSAGSLYVDGTLSNGQSSFEDSGEIIEGLTVTGDITVEEKGDIERNLIAQSITLTEDLDVLGHTTLHSASFGEVDSHSVTVNTLATAQTLSAGGDLSAASVTVGSAAVSGLSDLGALSATDATIGENLYVAGSADLGCTADAGAEIAGPLQVEKETTFQSDVATSGDAWVGDDFFANAGATVAGDVHAPGIVRLHSTVVQNSLDVVGDGNFGANVNVDGSLTGTNLHSEAITFGGQLSLSGDANVVGDFTSNVLTDVSGNVVFGGGLNVDGQSNFNDDVFISRDLQVNSGIFSDVQSRNAAFKGSLGVEGEVSIGQHLTVQNDLVVTHIDTESVHATDITVNDHTSLFTAQVAQDSTIGAAADVAGTVCVGENLGGIDASVDRNTVVRGDAEFDSADFNDLNVAGDSFLSDLIAQDTLSTTKSASFATTFETQQNLNTHSAQFSDRVDVDGTTTVHKDVWLRSYLNANSASFDDDVTVDADFTTGSLKADDFLKVGGIVTAGSTSAKNVAARNFRTAGNLQATDVNVAGNGAVENSLTSSSLTTGAAHVSEATIVSTLQVDEDLWVGEDLSVTENAVVGGKLSILLRADFESELVVDVDAVVGRDLLGASADATLVDVIAEGDVNSADLNIDSLAAGSLSATSIVVDTATTGNSMADSVDLEEVTIYGGVVSENGANLDGVVSFADSLWVGRDGNIGVTDVDDDARIGRDLTAPIADFVDVVAKDVFVKGSAAASDVKVGGDAQLEAVDATEVAAWSARYSDSVSTPTLDVKHDADVDSLASTALRVHQDLHAENINGNALTVSDDLYVGDNLVVSGTATLDTLYAQGNVAVAGEFSSQEDVFVGGDLSSMTISTGDFNTGDAEIGELHVGIDLVPEEGDSYLTGDLEVDGKVEIGCGGAIIPGKGEVYEHVTVDDEIRVGNDLIVGRDLYVNGTTFFEKVTGSDFFLSDTDVSDDITVNGQTDIDGQLMVNGDTWADSASVDGATTAVDVHTGPIKIGGDLTVSGHADFGADVSITKDLNAGNILTEDLHVAHDVTGTGNLSVAGSSALNDLSVETSLAATGVVVKGNLDTNEHTVTTEQQATALVTDTLAATASLTVNGPANVRGELTADSAVLSDAHFGSLDSTTFAVAGDTHIAGGADSTSLEVSSSAYFNSLQNSATETIQGSLWAHGVRVEGGLITAQTLKAGSVHTGPATVNADFVAHEATLSTLAITGDLSIGCEDPTLMNGEVSTANAATKSLSVSNDAAVGSLSVLGSSYLHDFEANSVESDSATLTGAAAITADATILNLNVAGTLSGATVSGSTISTKDLDVAGASTVDGTFTGDDEAYFGSLNAAAVAVTNAIHLEGAVNAEGNLVVSGQSTFGPLNIDGDANVADVNVGQNFEGAADLSVAGASSSGSAETGAFAGTTFDAAGNVYVADALTVTDTATFECEGGVQIEDTLTVIDASTVQNLRVDDDVSFTSTVINGHTYVGGNVHETVMGSTLNHVYVAGSANVRDTLLVNNDATVLGSITTPALNADTLTTGSLYAQTAQIGSQSVWGDAHFLNSLSVNDGLTVGRDAAILGNVDVTTEITVLGSSWLADVAASSLTISGDLVAVGSFAVQGDSTIDGASYSGSAQTGLLNATGALNVFGDVHVTDSLTVDGNVVFTDCDAGLAVRGEAAIGGSLTSGSVHVGPGGLTVQGTFNSQTGSLQSGSVEGTATFDELQVGGAFTATSGVFNSLDVAGKYETTNLTATTSGQAGSVEAKNVVIEGDLDVGCGSAQFDRDVTSSDIETINADVSCVARTEDISAAELYVANNAHVATTVDVDTVTKIGGDLLVNGTGDSTTLYVEILADVESLNAATFTVGGNTNVIGDTVLDGSLQVDSATKLFGDTQINAESFYMSGDFDVHGESQHAGLLSVASNQYVKGNSQVGGDATIGGDFEINGDLVVAGDTAVSGEVSAFGDVFLSGELSVDDNGIFRRDVTAGSGNINGTLTVGKDTWILGALNVTGPSHLLGDLQVDGDAYLRENLTVEQEAWLKDDLTVTGFTSINNDLWVEENVFVGGDLCVMEFASLKGELTVGGDLSVGGDFSAERDMIVQGETDVGEHARFGYLDVDGTVYVDGDLDVKRDATLADVDIEDTFTTDSLRVRGNVSLPQGSFESESLDVTGALSVGTDLYVTNDLEVLDHAGKDAEVQISGSGFANETIFDSLWVGEDLLVVGDVRVQQSANFDSNVNSTGPLSFGTLVAGIGNLGDSNADDTTVLGSAVIVGDSTFSGPFSVMGWLAVQTGDVRAVDFSTDGTFNARDGTATGLQVNSDLDTLELNVEGATTVDIDLHSLNTTVTGTHDVSGNVFYKDEFIVEGLVSIRDVLKVRHDAFVGEDLTVDENAHFKDSMETANAYFGSLTGAKAAETSNATFQSLHIRGSATVGDIDVVGAVSVGGEMLVTGDGNVLDGELYVSDNVQAGSLTIDENLSIGGELLVTTNLTVGDVYVEGDATVGDLTGTTLDIAGDLTIKGNAEFDTLDTTGDVNVHGDAGLHDSRVGNLTVDGFVHLQDELTVGGFVSLCDDLHVQGSLSIGGELCVQEHTDFDDDLNIAGNMTVAGNFDLTGSLYADTATIGGDLITEELSVMEDVWICGEFTHKEDLTINGQITANDVEILETLTVCGNITFEDAVKVTGDFDATDLTVEGDTEIHERFEIMGGPLSFRYNGSAEPAGFDNVRMPFDPLDSADEFVVTFAQAGPPFGELHRLVLSGCTFNILNPGERAAQVHRIETASFANGALVYQYEVGDLIVLKGSPDTLKTVTIWDFQQDLNSQGLATLDGNIYLGRSLQNEAANEFTLTLYSDALVVFIYSPRPQVGTMVNGNVYLQSTPVDWVKVF